MDTMLLRILVSTIVVSLLIFLILLIKRLLNNHMTVKAHYHIWYFLGIPLFASFLPWNYVRLGEGTHYFKSFLFFHKDTVPKSERINGAVASQGSNSDLLHDFTVSVNKSTPDFIYHTFFQFGSLECFFLLGLLFIQTIKSIKSKSRLRLFITKS